MQITYRKTNINYVYYDNNSKINLIFLHGWGQNIEMMMPIAKPYIKKYNVLVLDLPGFGLSDEPNEVWDIYEYADMVEYIRKELNMGNPILIGHSFGGKISLAYSIKYNPVKTVLLASPFRKAITKKSIKTKILKLMKKVPVVKKLEGYAKKHIGSTDYKNASEQMRKVLVKHLNLDLSNDLDKVKCPTLLIWGTKDTAVPYEDGKYLESNISNCGLVTYDGCTHYAYLERLAQTKNVINSFIGNGDEKE